MIWTQRGNIMKFTKSNPFGQKPNQQKKIKDIYTTMRNQKSNEKLQATENNLNKYLKNISNEKISPTARIERTFGKINDALDEIEKNLI